MKEFLIAFPSHGSMGEVENEGMTLRDYAASVVGHLFASGCHAEVNNTFEAAIAHMAADAIKLQMPC